MRHSLRVIGGERNLCDEIDFSAVLKVAPMRCIHEALALTHAREIRRRKLPYSAVVLLLIALSLYGELSIKHVLERVARPLRFIWPDPDAPMVRDSAFTYRRYQLGARPMAALFHHVCRPLAAPEADEAFRFGLRLMAIDGSVENAPNTPANEAAFGRRGSGRGPSAFVQLQCMFLVECGTHAIVDAGFWGCHAGEQKGAMRLLRSVSRGMLVMLDRGLFSYDLVHEILRRDAHVLVRLASTLKPKVVRKLADGSVLARIVPGRNSPNGSARRTAGEHLLVRILTYRFEDSAHPGRTTTARVLTTLLDAEQAAALDLIVCYHERWEIELVFDELGTHQRLAGRPLRSHRPVGVIQEL